MSLARDGRRRRARGRGEAGGALTVAITNEPASLLARAARHVIGRGVAYGTAFGRDVDRPAGLRKVTRTS